MQSFIRGTLVGIRPLMGNDKIYDRTLDIAVPPDFRIEIYDSVFKNVALSIGTTYNWLVGPAFINKEIAAKPSAETALWSAQIIQLDWTIPEEAFSHVIHRKHPDTDIVLMRAPFGLLMKPYSSIRRFTGAPKDKVTIGSYISWPKAGQLNLFGIE